MEFKGACNQLKPCQVQRNEAPVWSTHIRGAHGLLKAQCTSINKVEQIHLDLTNGALAKLESKSSTETSSYARVPVVFQTRVLNVAQRGAESSTASSGRPSLLCSIISWKKSFILVWKSPCRRKWARLYLILFTPFLHTRLCLVDRGSWTGIDTLEECLHWQKSTAAPYILPYLQKCVCKLQVPNCSYSRSEFLASQPAIFLWKPSTLFFLTVFYFYFYFTLLTQCCLVYFLFFLPFIQKSSQVAAPSWGLPGDGKWLLEVLFLPLSFSQLCGLSNRRLGQRLKYTQTWVLVM